MTVNLHKGAARDHVFPVKCATRQPPGRGLLMWMMPLHMCPNQKSDYEYRETEYLHCQIIMFLPQKHEDKYSGF